MKEYNLNESNDRRRNLTRNLLSNRGVNMYSTLKTDYTFKAYIIRIKTKTLGFKLCTGEVRLDPV